MERRGGGESGRKGAEPHLSRKGSEVGRTAILREPFIASLEFERFSIEPPPSARYLPGRFKQSEPITHLPLYHHQLSLLNI